MKTKLKEFGLAFQTVIYGATFFCLINIVNWKSESISFLFYMLITLLIGGAFLYIFKEFWNYNKK